MKNMIRILHAFSSQHWESNLERIALTYQLHIPLKMCWSHRICWSYMQLRATWAVKGRGAGGIRGAAQQIRWRDAATETEPRRRSPAHRPASHDLVQIETLSLASPADTHRRRAMPCQRNEICCRVPSLTSGAATKPSLVSIFTCPVLPLLRLPSRRPRRLPPGEQVQWHSCNTGELRGGLRDAALHERICYRAALISLSLELHHSFKPPQPPNSQRPEDIIVIHH